MWRRKRAPDPEPDPKLDRAERRVRDLEERARAVSEVLVPRQHRNHWREAVESLYRGERVSDPHACG